MRTAALVGTIGFALAVSATGAAQAARPLPIPPAYRIVAEEYGVPPSILYAVALAESVRTLENGAAPWPWTLNVRGRGLRFDTRESARKALEELLEAGERPDVGLMQVSWRWHDRLLRDPQLALDPWYNLRAGAAVLAAEHAATGDWWRAVGRYHSRDPEQAARYRARVRAWHERIGR
ncbi:MAG TPA: lytic transglycosylase [Polyangiaceae bacterium]|nr:lytic transglycosylase [Polyangiaceae bacterium]